MAATSSVASVNVRFNKPKALPFLPKTTSNLMAQQLPVGAAFRNRFEVRAHSMKDKMAASLTTGVLSAAVMVPGVATAVEEASGGSSSLKNFLLSIAAGCVVLVVILFAVIGVSNFDPVKRN